MIKHSGWDMREERLIKKFDKQAKMYQKKVEDRTMAMWRKELISEAYGNVLEVGVGAGANFPYYEKENVRVTGLDFSPKMIELAKETASNYQIRANFIEGNVEAVEFAANSFDFIVSTLTLCSYTNPVATLNKFSRWCKPNGKILLLEHGLSSNRFLSVMQKMIDPLFVQVSGCHCNRDIYQILEASALQTIRSDRYWQNIIYLVRARPIKNS